MTAARNTVAVDLAALQVKVEEGARRDQEARERDKEIFERLRSLDRTTADIKTDMMTYFGDVRVKIEQEFGSLRKDLAVQHERQKSASRNTGIKWAAIVSSVVGLLTVIADKWFK